MGEKIDLTPCNNNNGQTLTKPILQILKSLDNYGLEYYLEHTFDGLTNPKTGRSLRCDIYVPERNLVIEYDGPHHFMKLRENSDLKDVQYRDELKNQFFNDSYINLLRIPYTEKHPDAVVLKYLAGSEKYFYTMKDYQKDIDYFRSVVKNEDSEDYEIFTMYRGGIPLTAAVAAVHDKQYGIIQMQRFDGDDTSPKIIKDIDNIPNKIYIFDDLFETGETFEKCIKLLKKKFKETEIIPCALFGRKNNIDLKYIHEHPNKWIVFEPWETI